MSGATSGPSTQSHSHLMAEGKLHGCTDVRLLPSHQLCLNSSIKAIGWRF
jgi:hypothetical protein